MEMEKRVFINARCNKAIMNDKEYLEKAKDKNTDPDELCAMENEICYIRGYKDAMATILKCSQDM